MPQGVRPVLPASRALICALLGAALVACSSSEPPPEPTPTVEPTTAAPTPDPEPTDELPEEPEMPVPASGTPDERDAEAAAEYFIDLYNFTVSTGEVDRWEERSSECDFCANTAADVRRYREEGVRQVGGLITPGAFRFLEFDPGARLYMFEVPYEVAATSVEDANGIETEHYPAGGGFLAIEIGYVPGRGWVVMAVTHHDEALP